MDNSSLSIPNSLRNIIIIKRNHKRSNFQPEKIALAIKKSFDSIEDSQYTDDDSFSVYSAVIEQLGALSQTETTVSIEEIQDTIEKQLLRLNYEDVYESFASYRLRRAESRKVFLSDQHQFLKALENLSFNVDEHENALDTLIDFGSAITEQFGRAYLLDRDFVSLHDDGQIHIHHLHSYPLSTTASLIIPLDKIIDKQTDDMKKALIRLSWVHLSLQSDQHGEHAIDDFDLGLSFIVLASFKKMFKQTLLEYQTLTKHPFNKWDAFEKQIEKIKSIDLDLSAFEKYFNEDNSGILENAYLLTLKKVEHHVFKAMEGFLEVLKLNDRLPLSLNIGLGVTKESRIVSRQFLLAYGDHREVPTIIFKIKEGVNQQFEDDNYDLFDLVKQIRQTVLYQNANSPLSNNASYLPSGVRIASDLHQKNEPQPMGRGLLSMTSINLVRLAIQHLNDSKAFYEALDDVLDRVIEQLLARYQHQCKKTMDYFPYLMGLGLYYDSEKIKAKNNLSRALKHGLLGINLVGLKQVQQLVDFDESLLTHINHKLQQASEKHRLNFSLLALEFENVNERFKELDQLFYGKMSNLDSEPYSNGQIINQTLVSGGHLMTLEKFEVTELTGLFKLSSGY